MLRDLNDHHEYPQRVEADVLVIGAGIAGLVIATKLAKGGLRVFVAESGDRAQEAETHLLNRVEQTGHLYSGAEHGRFRCLGGTSTRWGGAMIPLRPEDMDSHTAGWVPNWGVPYERLMAYLPEIEKKFGLPAGPYEDRELIEPHGAAAMAFIARFAKWPPFRMRNVAVVFESRLRSPDGPEIWLNATVTAFDFDPAGRIRGGVARSIAGGRLEIKAYTVVVAAGAIESTRLLLIVDRQCGNKIFFPDDVLGRYLNDHLSAPIAELLPRSRIALNRVVGFRFEGAAMRNLRFEMLGTARRQSKLPASFTHIAYESEEEGGFEALRNVLRTVQKRPLPLLADLKRMSADAPWLARAVWWRYVHRRLLYPLKGTFTAQLVMEQMPRRENRITLSENALDPFGLPLASIHWRTGSEDERSFHQIANRFFDMWQQSGLSHLADLLPRDKSEYLKAVVAGGGIYHSGGTIRISKDHSNGVVDVNLRTFHVPNLYVVSTAILPVVGGANPTMTMMLYACYLADNLVRENRGCLRSGKHASDINCGDLEDRDKGVNSLNSRAVGEGKNETASRCE